MEQENKADTKRGGRKRKRLRNLHKSFISFFLQRSKSKSKKDKEGKIKSTVVVTKAAPLGGEAGGAAADEEEEGEWEQAGTLSHKARLLRILLADVAVAAAAAGVK